MSRSPARGPARASKLTSASASLPWGELVESFGRSLRDTSLPLLLDLWAAWEHVEGAKPSTRAMHHGSV
jgi:hypothetical protein